MLNTHMPFFASHENKKIELCCRKTGGFWKLHRKTDGEWTRVDTGREHDAVECAPTAEFVDGDWKISFVAGGAEGNRLFKLYALHGEKVELAEMPAAFGFVRSDISVFGNLPGIFKIRKHADGSLEEFKIREMDKILRISYDPDQRDHLLISGRCDEALTSWIYNYRTEELFELKADGEAAYKCAFRDGGCHYARQVGEGFEDREVVEAREIQITPAEENMIGRI